MRSTEQNKETKMKDKALKNWQKLIERSELRLDRELEEIKQEVATFKRELETGRTDDDLRDFELAAKALIRQMNRIVKSI